MSTKGLLGMLQDNNVNSSKQEFTIADFKQQIHDFYNALPRDNPRELVVLTGRGGMELIDEAIKNEVFVQRRIDARNNAGAAFVKGKITKQEFTNLTSMINSEDIENLIIAESIMGEILKSKK